MIKKLYIWAMENQNKVATVGKDGVSAKQTESQTKPLMITGMDAVGRLFSILQNEIILVTIVGSLAGLLIVKSVEFILKCIQ